MEQHVYAMSVLASVLAIDLDSQAEAQYLDRFGKALALEPHAMNAPHTQLGVPTLYT